MNPLDRYIEEGLLKRDVTANVKSIKGQLAYDALKDCLEKTMTDFDKTYYSPFNPNKPKLFDRNGEYLAKILDDGTIYLPVKSTLDFAFVPDNALFNISEIKFEKGASINIKSNSTSSLSQIFAPKCKVTGNPGTVMNSIRIQYNPQLKDFEGFPQDVRYIALDIVDTNQWKFPLGLPKKGIRYIGWTLLYSTLSNERYKLPDGRKMSPVDYAEYVYNNLKKECPQTRIVVKDVLDNTLNNNGIRVEDYRYK